MIKRTKEQDGEMEERQDSLRRIENVKRIGLGSNKFEALCIGMYHRDYCKAEEWEVSLGLS